jgi:uncharacterized protein YcfJ
MNKQFLAAAFVAATLVPSMALAQQTCEQRRDNRVVATIAGGGIGAVLGSVIAGRGDRTLGAVVGGVGGAVVGNQLTKPGQDCSRAYGYYDNNGMWHANAVARSDAAGYYDRSGAWVDGAPNGYYDNQGRWIAADASAQASIYTDSQGRWVPASVNGYYDTNGQLVSGAASGYYDQGRWVAGPATGRYDQNGRWLAGQTAGRRDANGVWIADAQPGYYDTNGRWRAGQVTGYYDAQGRWMNMGPMPVSQQQYGPDRVGQFDNRQQGPWADAPNDASARVAWLDERIRRASASGQISQAEATRNLRSLDMIRREDAANDMRVQARLDALNNSMRLDARGGPRR